MNLIWKLLSKHISKGQLLGFFFANLVGLTIILLGFQFYVDVLPCFTGEDSFMNDDQVVLTKAVRSSSVVSGQTNLFSPDDVEDLRSQPFVESLGVFSSNEYHANATMSIEGNTISIPKYISKAYPTGLLISTRVSGIMLRAIG